MKNETLPRVYARALLELADEKGILPEVHEAIECLDQTVRNPAARTLAETPRVSRDQKQALIERVYRGRIPDIVVDFIHLVVRRGRTLLLRDMYSEFLALHDDRIGLVRAKAITAVPLSESSRQLLVTSVERALAKKVDLKSVVDAGMLGGIVVRCAGLVADGSIRTDLEKIRRRMLEHRFGKELIHED